MTVPILEFSPMSNSPLVEWEDRTDNHRAIRLGIRTGWADRNGVRNRLMCFESGQSGPDRLMVDLAIYPDCNSEAITLYRPKLVSTELAIDFLSNAIPAAHIFRRTIGLNPKREPLPTHEGIRPSLCAVVSTKLVPNDIEGGRSEAVVNLFSRRSPDPNRLSRLLEWDRGMSLEYCGGRLCIWPPSLGGAELGFDRPPLLILDGYFRCHTDEPICDLYSCTGFDDKNLPIFRIPEGWCIWDDK